jgi:hypothetical protein
MEKELCPSIKPAVLLSLAVALLMQPVAEAEIITGNQLLERCESGPSLDLGYCYGFVVGVASTLEFVKNERFPIGTSGHTFYESAICVGDGVTTGQLADVTRRYLITHPQTRHHDAGALTFQALHEAFLCQ